ncbi:hypothetical protein R75465_04351 [Paraburkholderia aspalathi]|nr:hypothetical protein R75465_04351 [Paraburkholderia aspalathi]
MFIQNALDFLPILLKGAVVTVEITFCAFVLSTLLGLVLALMRVSSNKVLSNAAATFIN